MWNKYNVKQMRNIYIYIYIYIYISSIFINNYINRSFIFQVWKRDWTRKRKRRILLYNVKQILKQWEPLIAHVYILSIFINNYINQSFIFQVWKRNWKRKRKRKKRILLYNVKQMLKQWEPLITHILSIFINNYINRWFIFQVWKQISMNNYINRSFIFRFESDIEGGRRRRGYYRIM